MNQSEIINYLCDSLKYMQYLQKEMKEQKRIEVFEKQNKTQEQRIKECTQRFVQDLIELITIYSELNNGDNANQTK